MLELIFQGFLEWAYGLALECWQYFSTALLDIMSMDFAYLKSHAPVVDEIMQILLAVGWALLIGNLVFQALMHIFCMPHLHLWLRIRSHLQM